MESIFRVPLASLTLDGLREFLADAGDEGLTWEAKGPRADRLDEPLEPRHVWEAACGLANATGGYLVLGAVQNKQTGERSLPGCKIKHAEPGTWIDDVIGALRPRPMIGDPKVWKVDGERVAAVVEVHSVAVPPCMTPGGLIYERTSGKTVKVTDPLVLARLTDAGKAARDAAQSGAGAAVESLRDHLLMPDKSMNLYLGLCATAYEPDISARLFADANETEPATVHQLDALISTGLRPDRYHQGQSAISRSVRQDAHIHRTGPGAFANDPDGGDHLWIVRTAWDGSVGVRCAGNEPRIGIELLLEDVVVPAWRVASQILPLLGAYGPAHLALEILDGFKLHDEFHGPVDWPRTIVRRWLDDPTPTPDMVASLRRELLRTAGVAAWEPTSGREA